MFRFYTPWKRQKMEYSLKMGLLLFFMLVSVSEHLYNLFGLNLF